MMSADRTVDELNRVHEATIAAIQAAEEVKTSKREELIARYRERRRLDEEEAARQFGHQQLHLGGDTMSVLSTMSSMGVDYEDDYSGIDFEAGMRDERPADGGASGGQAAKQGLGGDGGDERDTERGEKNKGPR